MKKVLVTGSTGLIGSEAVKFFCGLGYFVYGIDNNLRKYFFGDDGDTFWNRSILEQEYKNYRHINTDIRDQKSVESIFSENKFELIIHAAAQPSHDWAAKEPLTDFSINATGTLILLEATRKFCPEAVFIFTSTNKVYGDNPNKLPLIERETRFEIDPIHPFKNGINESMSLDHTKHSVFGVSKLAADVMVQEYGKYFGLKTGVFRGGCLTGPSHSPSKLHGFLAYLVKCIAVGEEYTIFGYKGKQVRDNVHAYDVISAFYEFYSNPRSGEVYNMGGSRFSNTSMMEAIEKIESSLGRKGRINYSEENRIGDHIWYVSDVSKFRKDYPKWQYRYNLDSIIAELCEKGHYSKVSVSTLVLSEFNFNNATNILFPEKIFVSSHITEIFGPVQALKNYLLRRFSKVVFVEHPFTYTSIGSSRLESYRGGLESSKKERRQSASEFLSYFRDFILTFFWFLRHGRDSKIFIGIDCLNALVGVILKKFGFRLSLIYYSTEYTPKRFENDILNKIYHYIDLLCVRNANSVWSVSKRASDIRRTQGLVDSKNLVLGAGVEASILESLATSDRNSLIYTGHITQSKGLDLIVKCFPKLLEHNPDFKLKIVGVGPYEAELKDLIRKHGLDGSVEIVPSTIPNRYSSDMQSSGIGLAIFPGDETSSHFYSEPSNVYEYMSCGLPVIVTDILPVSEKVRENNFGLVIKYSEDEFVASVLKLNKDIIFFNLCKDNLKNRLNTLSWEEIFEKGMSGILKNEMLQLRLI